MKIFKSGAKKELKNLTGSKKDKKKKARPTCKKDEDEEKKKQQINKNPKYKFLNIQMEKLENMYVILTAEDGMSKYTITWEISSIDMGKIMDEFERDFKKLREEVRNVKDKLNERQDIIKTISQKNA